MKRPIHLLLLALLCAASCGGPQRKTALYEQYEHCSDIKAACLMGYDLGEGLRVDVTILQAHSPEAFERLMSDMGLTAADFAVGRVIVSGRGAGCDGRHCVQTFGASITYRTVYVFQSDEAASRRVVDYLAEKMNNYMIDKI